MLIKLITDHGDFERALKRRRLLSVGFLALGILGQVCYFTLVKNSNLLPDLAQGFYLGASSGITAGALVLLLRTQYLITHPKAKKEARVAEQDERTKTIAAMSFQAAGLITLFLSAAALFVLVAVSRAAALAVFFIIILYAAVMFCSLAYYSKKL